MENNMNNINAKDNEVTKCPKGSKCKKCDKVLTLGNFSWNTGNDDTYYVTCASCGNKHEFHFKK